MQNNSWTLCGGHGPYSDHHVQMLRILYLVLGQQPLGTPLSMKIPRKWGASLVFCLHSMHHASHQRSSQICYLLHKELGCSKMLKLLKCPFNLTSWPWPSDLEVHPSLGTSHIHCISSLKVCKCWWWHTGCSKWCIHSNTALSHIQLHEREWRTKLSIWVSPCWKCLTLSPVCWYTRLAIC